VRKMLARIGGPNGITLAAWLLLAPISVFLTHYVVPEGLQESPVPAAGILVGTIGHLVTGLVLLLGKLIFLGGVGLRPKPTTTLLIMLVAGVARGFSVSYSLELFGLVASADYLERIRSGAVLIIVWFSVTALVVDSRQSYRVGYQKLEEAIADQLNIRHQGEAQIDQARTDILEQIKATLKSALVLGSSSRDLHNAVDDLVSPLSHRLASEIQRFTAEPVKIKSRIQVRPVIRAAFSETGFSPIPTATMSVLGTISSLFWAEGPIALAGAAVDFLVVFGVLELAKRLAIKGAFTPLAWFTAGLAAAALSDLVTNPDPLDNPLVLLLLSINVMVPAALFAFLAAFEKQAEANLQLLRENLSLLGLETQALEQRLWIERKRLARFVHSELQSRLRAFALRLEFEGSEPSEAQVAQLRVECEEALVFDDETQSFERFLGIQKQLWSGVTNLGLSASRETLDLLLQDSYATGIAIELVREGITNAVKHAKSKNIVVSLRADFGFDQIGELEVEVRNDGSSLKEGPVGMGAAIFSELAPDFSLTSDGSETVLRFKVVMRSRDIENVHSMEPHTSGGPS